MRVESRSMSAPKKDIALFSYSHHNTTVEERDKIALSADEITRLLPEFSKAFRGEAGILSTCNRTEFYVVGEAPRLSWETLAPLVERARGADVRNMPRPEFKRSRDAARHLFRVASSLESMALGEDQILAQVKDAHELLLSAPTKAKTLDELFQRAIHVGKKVRSDTSLCRGGVSISSSSVELARKIFGDLKGCHVLLVGAGETAAGAAVHFQAAGVSGFTVTNRSAGRGEELAERFGGDYVPLSRLDEAFDKADIAVFATGAKEYLVEAKPFKKVMRRRRHRQLFVIDISNPRNVDPKLGDLDGVYLFNIDDLEQVIAENMRGRAAEIPRVESIIEENLGDWELWIQTNRVRPTIGAMHRYFQGVREQELERMLGEFSSDADRQLAQKLTNQLVKKLLHYPIAHLREGAEERTIRSEDIDLINALFKLEE